MILSSKFKLTHIKLLMGQGCLFWLLQFLFPLYRLVSWDFKSKQTKQQKELSALEFFFRVQFDHRSSNLSPRFLIINFYWVLSISLPLKVMNDSTLNFNVTFSIFNCLSCLRLLMWLWSLSNSCSISRKVLLYSVIFLSRFLYSDSNFVFSNF